MGMRAYGLLKKAIGFVVVLYVGQALWLYFYQDRLVFHPDTMLHETPAVPYDDVWIKTKDGIRLHGWWIPKDSAALTALVLHGNTGNISDRLREADFFRRLGMNVFMMDYRGFGRSQKAALTDQAIYQDSEAAWAYLTQERGIDPDTIILCGRSLGASPAIYLASRHLPRAVILESGFLSLADVAQSRYPIFPAKFLLKSRFDMSEAVKHVRSSTLVVHSPDDKVVPYAEGLKLYEALTTDKEFLKISGPHNEGYYLNEASYQDAVEAFLKKEIP